MRKILSLILAAIISFSSFGALTSCDLHLPDTENSEKNPEPNNTPQEIITPELRDYPERNTVKFTEIKYIRPDIEKISSDFSAAAAAISDESLSFEEKLDGIIALEGSYTELLTMLSYSRIRRSEDVSDTYWNDEYAYISENYPSFSKVLEELFVAAATSPDAERFEDEYFGEGLIEKYSDGGSITDALVALTTRETELENEYSELSEANVIITYRGTTDTCESLLEKHKDERNFEKTKAEIEMLYKSAYSERTNEIFVELVKVRRSIANERGLDSYTEHAYEAVNHEYNEGKILSLIDGIAEHVVPVWATLETYVFSTTDDSDSEKLDRVSLINELYDVYERMDDGLLDAYSYMLGYNLYDVNGASTNRYEGSFATYLYAYDAPYLFVTTNGTNDDYMTMSHEFGHFFDSYVNYGGETSIDLSEVSSTALEYLTFLSIGDELGDKARDMHFSLVRDALSVLVFQSFYALFEHNVYSIPENEISKASIEDAMFRAAESMNLNTEALEPNPDAGIFNPLDFVLIPHLFISPCYVESYCTSVIVSLELYFLEKSNTGEGIKAYLDLINREDTPLLFEDYIKESGLKSPFEPGLIRELAYKLYYDILGDYRFDENKNTNSKKSIPYAA